MASCVSCLPTWAQDLCQNIENNDSPLTKVTVVGMENDVAIALAHVLGNNSTVREIDLDLSFVHEDGIAALGNMLAMNTYIRIARIETCFNDNLHYPSSEARKYEQKCSRAAIARGLVDNQKVNKLILDGHGFDDEFWQCLSQNRHLQELHISRVHLPPFFSQCYLTNAQHSLKKLAISNSIVYTGDDTDFVNSGLLCHALNASSSQQIHLSSVRVALLEHGETQYSDLRRDVMVPRFINIGRFRNDVLFVERGFTSDCAVALAAKLETNQSLKRLYLPENPVGSLGVVALSNMLQHNTTLQMLDIRNVFIDDTEKATSALGQALCKNSSLVELRVGLNRGINFANDIAQALQVNTTLKKLDLSSTSVGDEGACKLAEALETNHSLRALKLNQSRIGAVGATAVAQALLQTASLKELELTGNNVCESGSQALLNAVKENYRLEKLSLDTTPSIQQEIDYWMRLTPCGRALLKQHVIPQLVPRVLHRISKGGGEDSLFTVLSARPDLLKR